MTTFRMNVPNQLTTARFFLTGIFVVALSTNWPFHVTVGLIVFVIAGVTDYLDGSIARSRNLVTDFGKLMDPLADKIMVAAAFICLVPLQAIPPWVAILVIAREFLITGLRLLAAGKGTILPSERLGKHKTAWQIITVIFFLLLLSLQEWQGAGIISSTLLDPVAFLLPYGGRVIIAVTLGLTITSGFRYLWKHRSLIESA
ncbi:MAG: CDP-diacylglycerol--glycerol-3-phosphate 3-phosphatidyltransferase [Verrucomicrobia bacterium]|nr:CDP-diacylglycerol--glycerol-3-phosphate 3-phosphatidyltransferase [Verrucomicrobiota bacterium]